MPLTEKNERVALFIDAANLFYTQRELGWYIDFEKLYNHFTDGFVVYNAFYYTGKKEGKSLDFLRALMKLGYTVRTKEVKKIYNHPMQKIVEKCNLDIEIVIDMFNTVENYDKAVLFSGDSDFERAIELIRSKGKRILVVSTKKNASWELINVADKFIDIKNLRNTIEKSPKK